MKVKHIVDHPIAETDIALEAQIGLKNFSVLRFAENHAEGFDEICPLIFAASASMLLLMLEN